MYKMLRKFVTKFVAYFQRILRIPETKFVGFSKFVGFLATNEFVTFYTTGPRLQIFGVTVLSIFHEHFVAVLYSHLSKNFHENVSYTKKMQVLRMNLAKLNRYITHRTGL